MTFFLWVSYRSTDVRLTGTANGENPTKFILAACLLLFQSAAKAEAVEVESFGFPYAPGRFERFNDVMPSELGAGTTAAIKERYPSIQNIQLFCTGLSGPRLAYIDGVFFALNEKAGDRVPPSGVAG